MLERHLSKRERQRVAIKKKSQPRISGATDFERIKKNIFRASEKTEKNQEISIVDRIFSGRPILEEGGPVSGLHRAPPAGTT
jgi:hypothetical protein